MPRRGQRHILQLDHSHQQLFQQRDNKENAYDLSKEELSKYTLAKKINSSNDNGQLHEQKSPFPAHLRLQTVCFSVPDPRKDPAIGEDASFHTKDSVGVFDGVGSWKREGIDGGEYARALSDLTQHYIECGHGVKESLRMSTRENELKGSSTAMVLQVNGRKLTGINVGDSVCFVYRDGRFVFRCRRSIHGFNYPHQVGYRRDKSLINARPFCFQLTEGDLIISATDGLTDNVFTADILRIIRRHMEEWKYCPPKQEKERFSGDIFDSDVLEGSMSSRTHVQSSRLKSIAEALANKACEMAHSRRGLSPFGHAARKERISFDGGKLDDITIVVSLAVTSDDRCSIRYRARFS